MQGSNSLEKSMSVTSTAPHVSKDTYKRLKDWIEHNCGIALSDSKVYLVETRLAPILAKLKCTSFDELVQKLSLRADPAIKDEIIDAITTNETLWFRDTSVWDFIEKTYLKEKLAENKGKLRIWSAASSSGQEIYSLAMLMDAMAEKNPQFSTAVRSAEMLATDVSKNILQVAKRGRYSRMEMSRGLHPNYKEKYFDKDRLFSTLKPEIRNRIKFDTLNLQSNFNHLGTFDTILCRNVTIYFSREFRQNLLWRLEKALKPGGVLIIGATESIIGFETKLKTRPGSPSSFYYND